MDLSFEFLTTQKILPTTNITQPGQAAQMYKLAWLYTGGKG
jgi:hypothetical protein